MGIGTRRALSAQALVACVAFLLACERSCSDSRREQDALLAAPAPEQILAGLERRDIGVVLETDRGDVRCTLDAREAPRGVALFLGLATGRAARLDARSGEVTQTPLYEGRRFFRGVPGIFVQTGCPRDDGTGHPGYRIEPEPRADDAARLGRGALFFATYTSAPGRADPDPPPPGHTIGSQFVIALTDMRHLAGTTTVLGRCDDLDVVERIASDHGTGQRALLRRVRVLEQP